MESWMKTRPDSTGCVFGLGFVADLLSRLGLGLNVERPFRDVWEFTWWRLTRIDAW